MIAFETQPTYEPVEVKPQPKNWLEALANWAKDARPIPIEFPGPPLRARNARARRRAHEKFQYKALPYRDQTMTVLSHGARLTRAHRRGNVQPVLINPRRRHKYLHRHGRKTVELQQAA